MYTIKVFIYKTSVLIYKNIKVQSQSRKSYHYQ